MGLSSSPHAFLGCLHYQVRVESLELYCFLASQEKAKESKMLGAAEVRDEKTGQSARASIQVNEGESRQCI
jgi:hypothetical protein